MILGNDPSFPLDGSNYSREEREVLIVVARFPEGTAVGEEHGLADLRESHRRAEHRDYRRLSDVHHGVIAPGE